MTEAPAHPNGARDDGGRSLVRSSAVVGLGTALSRVTGFLRVSAMAAIGFARLTDVYNIANSTPNIVYELLLGGILTATIVPLFVESMERDDERGTDAINSAAIVGLLLITVLGFLAAPWIIRLYTLRLHGADRAAQQRLATDLLRLFMPQIFFYGITALATAMLNARRKFAAAAFAPVLNNVVVIAVFLALPLVQRDPTVHSVLADPALVWLLGLGTTLGIVAMAVVLLPALRGAGARFHFVLDWRNPAIKKLLRLSGWTVGYVAANQIAFWIALFLAYGRSGDASVYLAAFILFQLPHGLFAVSIMTALAPELASRASHGDFAGVRRQFSLGLRLMGIVVLPSTAVLLVLSGPIVDALLHYGNFSAHSSTATATTLTAFGAGLCFFSAYLYILRGFYSLQDTRTPFLLNCFENGVNIVAAFALYPWLGVQGLGLAWSIAYAAAAVLALVAWRRRLGSLEGYRTTRALVRMLVASLLLAGTCAGVAALMGTGPGLHGAVTTVVALGLGTLVYVAALHRMRVDELRTLRDALRRGPSPSPSAGVGA